MPPIRFVNLERDTTRRASMERELAAQGLQGERFEAVLWSALATDEQQAIYSPELNARQHHIPLVNGEKGCYASHLALWRWLLASEHACAIVLEDDVRLEPSFAKACAAIGRMQMPWHMIKLIGREGLGKSEKLAGSKALTDEHAVITYQRVPSLTAGYAIHREGAAKLLASRVPFGRPIDVDLRHWWESGTDFRLLGLRPAVIALDDTSQESSIKASLKSLPWPQRWRKFLLKTRYTLANARHSTS